jgi:Raf kinase inhibitor-like YbhB/YbcL family protein
MIPPTSGQDLSIIDTTTTAAATTEQLESAFQLVLPWAEGAAIDPRFTCDGADTSPSASWTGMPVGTAEYALVVRNRDAGNFVHWVVTGIPGVNTFVPEGQPAAGAVTLLNDFGTPGWRGPCNPPATHTYEFTLYALPEPLGLQPTLTAAEAIQALEIAAVDVAIATGTYPAA